MADKLRVHTLSKELGVSSKAILDKCKMEGVAGVTNHMSTLSAGLAETIREWFSESGHGTAVETAAPVDLEKVRTRRRSRKKKEGIEEHEADTQVEVLTEDEGIESGAAVELPLAEPEPPVAEPVAAPVEPGEEPAEVVQELAVISEPIVEAPAPPAPAPVEEAPPVPSIAAEAPSTAPAAAAASPPAAAAPTPKLAPAGPQNVPAPAQMKGPRVVGYARPDPVARPAPRSSFRPGPGGPGGGGAGDRTSPPPLTPRRGVRGRTKEEEEAELKKAKARANPRRSSGSLSEVGERLKEWNDRDLLERQERLQAASGRGIHARRAREGRSDSPHVVIAPRKTKAVVNEPIIMHELTAATGIGINQLFHRFKNEHNLLVSRNSIIPSDIAQTIMLDFGVELEVVKPKTKFEQLLEQVAAMERKNLKPRPPVVTMLGHVDHGKTSLLDAIRKTQVAAGEAGGITQHIGAYRVEREGLSVTFLDTPGHEAFTAMRARGANMTDVVVLVVAADDGVMPQTLEAINHAKAAKVNIVIALNKIDLPGVDLNKIYGQLAEVGLTPTEWGGETDVIKTSATTGEGVDELIAHLTTLSELLDLKADPTLPANGTVVEAQMQTGTGPLARVLVREGTLRIGDYMICGRAAGRVRMLLDDRGRRIKEVGPGLPGQVSGLEEVPDAGDPFHCVDSLQRAKEIASETRDTRRQESLAKLAKPKTLDELFRQREAGAIPELNLILRADMQGSVDAIVKTLGDIPSDQVKLNLLHTGIGAVTESDVVLAQASGALVVGFSVAAEPAAQRLADVEGVDIRLYRIIYEVVDDIRKALEGLLPREQNEENRGKAVVREIFHVSRVGTVAGCMVTDGIVGRSHYVRVIRDGQIVVPTAEDVKRKQHRALASLRRFKDDAKEVRAGMECGMRIQDFDDVKPGDVLETYEVVETARKL